MSLVEAITTLIGVLFAASLAATFLLVQRVVRIQLLEKKHGGRYGQAIHNAYQRHDSLLAVARQVGIGLEDAAELRVLALHQLRIVANLKRLKAHDDAMAIIHGGEPKKLTEEHEIRGMQLNRVMERDQLRQYREKVKANEDVWFRMRADQEFYPIPAHDGVTRRDGHSD